MLSPREGIAALLGLVVACGGGGVDQVGVAFDRDPPAVGPLQGRIVTTNSGDDSLSVVDPVDLSAPVRHLPVGLNPVDLEGPHHLVADPLGRFLYVNLSLAVAGSGSGPHGTHGAGDLDGYVLKLDASTGREIARRRVDPNPGDSTLSSDGRTLYVTHYDVLRWRNGTRDGSRVGRERDSDLLVIDTETMSLKERVSLCPAAHGVRLARDGAALYATCGPDELARVEWRGGVPTVRRFPIPGGAVGGTSCLRCPYALEIAPDGTVWVSNLGANGGSNGGGSVEVFDPKHEGQGGFDPSRAIPLLGSPVFSSFTGTAESYRAHVPEQGSLRMLEERVRRFDVSGADRVPKALTPLSLEPDVCHRPHMMLVEPDGRRGHLICEGDHLPKERAGEGGDFLWLDLERVVVVRKESIGVFPDGLVLVPPLARASADVAR